MKLISLALLLAGCASTGVVPTDKDTFMLAKTSPACGLRSAEGTKADLYIEANEFCAKRTQAVETVKLDGTDGMLFAKCASATLTFKCVAK